LHERNPNSPWLAFPSPSCEFPNGAVPGRRISPAISSLEIVSFFLRRPPLSSVFCPPESFLVHFYSPFALNLSAHSGRVIFGGRNPWTDSHPPYPFFHAPLSPSPSLVWPNGLSRLKKKFGLNLLIAFSAESSDPAP